MVKFIFFFTISLSFVGVFECTRFTYLQEYVVGDPTETGYNVVTSSRISGFVEVTPYLAGDTLQWIVNLSNFNIHFNGSDPELLHIFCSTFVSNPVLNTLLLEEEDPRFNSCPDELKSHIGSALFSEAIYKQTLNFTNFADANCPPMTQLKQEMGSDCTVETTLQNLNNCSMLPDAKNNIVLHYFKRNFTIKAAFVNCQLEVTELKELTTERYYMSKKNSYVRIAETFLQVDEDTNRLEPTMPGNLKKKIGISAHEEPSLDWFEVYSLMNAIYAPDITYNALAEWVFS